MLRRILTALNYVGVMAMEAFRVGDELLINELARAYTIPATGAKPVPASANLNTICAP